MPHGGQWLSIENGGLQDFAARHQVIPASQQQPWHAPLLSGWGPVIATDGAYRAALVWCIWQCRRRVAGLVAIC